MMMTIVMMLLMVQYTNGDVKAHKVFISKLSLYISTYCAGYMSNQMSLLHFRKTSACLLYTSPSPRDRQKTRMPSSA